MRENHEYVVQIQQIKRGKESSEEFIERVNILLLGKPSNTTVRLITGNDLLGNPTFVGVFLIYRTQRFDSARTDRELDNDMNDIISNRH